MDEWEDKKKHGKKFQVNIKKKKALKRTCHVYRRPKSVVWPSQVSKGLLKKDRDKKEKEKLG